jgi:hypothetical protein
MNEMIVSFNKKAGTQANEETGYSFAIFSCGYLTNSKKFQLQLQYYFDFWIIKEFSAKGNP